MSILRRESSSDSGTHSQPRINRRRAGLLLCRIVTIALIGCTVLLCPFAIDAATYDIAILNGTVISGPENEQPYRADVGIIGKEIVKVGRIAPEEARQIIDATNLFVVPGFIDMHTHSDVEIEENRHAVNYLLQGVTTVVGGNCGGSNYPLKKFFRSLKSGGIGVNFCSLVGHNTVRRIVMGSRQQPFGDDIQRMKSLIRKEMRSGAMGLSTGLVYHPGYLSSTLELIDLGSVVAKYGGLYASHVRDEGDFVKTAVEEAIRIGEENGMRVQISHIKLGTPNVYGHPELIYGPIQEARARGLEVTTDQYPYTAWPGSLWTYVPAWAWGSGYEDFLKFLENSENHRALRDYYVDTGIAAECMDHLMISLNEAEPTYQGKRLRQILKMKGLAHTPENAAEVIIELQKGGFVIVFFFGLRQADVKSMVSLPFNMIGSDSIALDFEEEGIPHPRNLGTFPRAIRLFVKKKKILSLDTAIYKMTTLPAQVLRLKNRGVVDTGYRADLVVFDLKKLKDTATYKKAGYPKGIVCVIVNGQIAAWKGDLTGALAGEVIYGPGKKTLTD